MMGFIGGASGSPVSTRPLQGLEAKVTYVGSQACLRDPPPRRTGAPKLRGASLGGTPPMTSHVLRERLVPGVPGTCPTRPLPGLVFSVRLGS